LASVIFGAAPGVKQGKHGRAGRADRSPPLLGAAESLHPPPGRVWVSSNVKVSVPRMKNDLSIKQGSVIYAMK
jgi:hypothetical protein